MSDDPVLAALTRLETGQVSLRADLAGLGAGQGSLGADLARLRADVMDRIDRLQNTVEGMRDDIRVNCGASDRATRIASGASEEVRALGAEVSAMERQIMRLRADVDELKKSA